jgi:hypothetical protein
LPSNRSIFRLLILLCLTTISFTQTDTATISGRVTDQHGRPVQDTEMVITNVDTNISFRQATNNDGLYVLSGLKPGQYRITATKGGFRTVNLTDIVLNVQDSISQNFKLLVGSVSESITVVADEAKLNTTDAAVSTVIDRQFAENLPMNGRSFQTLIQLTPGVVVAPANTGDNGQFNINGQRAASNYWMVDGVSANIGAGSGATGQGQGVGGAVPGLSVQGGTNSLVSVDALQEFRIQTSTYAPEFGRTPGGQISIVTRSGTNQFHGTAFDYLRNDKLDANDWFANANKLPKPEERQNDFGGTFSGPIQKDRTFFFFSYEGLRLRLPQVAETIVPSIGARQGAVPATQPLLNAFPVPNGTDFGNGTAQFHASFSNASTLNATSLRIDHRVSDKLSLFARYNYSPSELVSRASALSQLTATTNVLQTATLGATWGSVAGINNDLRFNYSRSTSSLSNSLDDIGGAIPLTSAELNLPSPFTLRNSEFADFILSAGLLVDGTLGDLVQRQYNAVDNVTLQKGSHSLKFGIDYRRLTPSWNPFQYELVPLFANVLAAENGQLLETIVQSERKASLRLQNLGTFVQDTWRIKPRVTLTYGLRWDLDFVPSSDPDLPAFMNFNLSNLATLALAPSGVQPYSTKYGNVAPRAGAAYQVSQRQGWEMVLRGGFGVFYDLASQEIGNALSQSQYPFGARTNIIGGIYGSLNPSQLTPPPITAANVSVNGTRGFDPNLTLPYTLQWNVAVEQALGPQQIVSASYVGSAGRRLLQTADQFSPNPAFAEVQILTNEATSDYDALQVQLQRRLSHGLQALASYTWSHSIDTASGSSLIGNSANTFVPGIDPSVERGPSDFDIRNVFSAAVTYDIPTLRLNGLTKAVLGGWSVQNIIQVRSASPVNIYYSNFYGSNAFNSGIFIRPDIVPGQPLYLFGAQCTQVPPAGLGSPCPGGKGFNSNAFISPPVDLNGNPVRQGNIGRNELRGFGASQWDLAVHRDFPIRESLKLQFRAEMFNILNHPNFAPPIGDLIDPLSPNPQFGQSIQMLNQFLGGGVGTGGGFSALYQVGGPRSIQLALKILF